MLEWEVTIPDKSCEQAHVLNPSIVDCGGKNVRQCLDLGRHLTLTTNPAECAIACKGLVSMFMFGSNESDISQCNERGCICSCGENIIFDGKCDNTRRHGFQTHQFIKETIGKSLQAHNILPDIYF